MKSKESLSFCFAIFFSLAMSHIAMAQIYMFGSGSNQFSMDFAPIGNPNNPDDMTSEPVAAGGVGYNYIIGRYEVSEDMINKFNASQSLQITQDNRGANKPATNVSWNESARFVNWLNTSLGFQPAYNFTTSGVSDNISLWNPSDAWQLGGQNLFRHKDTHFWLPSLDEWYKAAYYDPSLNIYFDYTTGSNTEPTPVASGTAPGTQIYQQSLNGGPADVTVAGAMGPNGTMALGGNVYEWLESEFDQTNDNPGSERESRGGIWFSSPYHVSSVARVHELPTEENFCIGFRVASLPAVPEPNSLLLLSLTCMGSLLFRGPRSSK